MTEEEIKRTKEKEKEKFMSQILESTITEQEEVVENAASDEVDESTASQEINNLLQQMREEVFVGIKKENKRESLKREIMQY